MRVHGHTLVWHRQLPAGSTPALSRRRWRAALASHIETLVGRYAGRVASWDVVNEAVADHGRPPRHRTSCAPTAPATSRRPSGWPTRPIRTPGSTTTTTAPRARAPKSDAVYALVRRLLDQGVPIHGVGLQMHLRADAAAGARRRPGERRAAPRARPRGPDLGDGRADPHVRRDDPLAVQRRVYHDAIAACAGMPGFAGVTFWGVSDAHSWIHGASARTRPCSSTGTTRRSPPTSACATRSRRVRRPRPSRSRASSPRTSSDQK